MNSIQISSILKRTTVGGVFASDKLPKEISIPKYVIIVNTDPSTKPGSHWVAIFISNGNAVDYFDSYGRPPVVNSIRTFLRKFPKIQINSIQVQGSFSSVCGHHSLYFAIQRWNNIPMEEIVRKFSCDLEENDAMVTEWINDNFDLDTDTYDVEFLINQICHAMST